MRNIQFPFPITAPAAWASYFVMGDASGMAAGEQARANAWLKREGVEILDIARHPETGEPYDARFTWSLRLYAPEADCDGGDVFDYVAVTAKI